MTGKAGDTAIVSASDGPKSLDAQVALSQSVQSLTKERLKAPTDHDQLAAPTSKWDRFVAISAQGLKKAPEGMLHALEDPANLIVNAEISVAVGTAAKLLLPEEGVIGWALAIGLGASITM